MKYNQKLGRKYLFQVYFFLAFFVTALLSVSLNISSVDAATLCGDIVNPSTQCFSTIEKCKEKSTPARIHTSVCDYLCTDSSKPVSCPNLNAITGEVKPGSSSTANQPQPKKYCEEAKRRCLEKSSVCNSFQDEVYVSQCDGVCQGLDSTDYPYMCVSTLNKNVVPDPSKSYNKKQPITSETPIIATTTTTKPATKDPKPTEATVPAYCTDGSKGVYSCADTTCPSGRTALLECQTVCKSSSYTNAVTCFDSNKVGSTSALASPYASCDPAKTQCPDTASTTLTGNGQGIVIPPNTGLPDPAGGILQVLNNFFSWLFLIFGMLALGAFILSGVQYLLSAGSDDMIETAKLNMKWSLVGVMVGLSGYIVLKAVFMALSGTNPIF